MNGRVGKAGWGQERSLDCEASLLLYLVGTEEVLQTTKQKKDTILTAF